MQLIIGTYTVQLPHVQGKADGILGASFDPARLPNFACTLPGAVTT